MNKIQLKNQILFWKKVNLKCKKYILENKIWNTKSRNIFQKRIFKI